MSQQHVSGSQGQTCSDNCTCCHTEIELAYQTFHLTQSQYTDTGRTSPSADPITSGSGDGQTVCWLVGCLTSQQHCSVSQGQTCSDNCTCCCTEIELAYQIFHLTQSQYTDTGRTSPSGDPATPGSGRAATGASGNRIPGVPHSRRTP